MAFMDDMLDRFSQASQSLGKKARDFTELTKLSSVINEEEKEIESTYADIGYIIYRKYKDNPPAEFAEKIAKIKELTEKVERDREKQRVLANIESCPVCGANVKRGMTFCSACGHKLTETEKNEEAASKKFCSKCGAPLEKGVMFCAVCGQKAADSNLSNEQNVIEQESASYDQNSEDMDYNN